MGWGDGEVKRPGGCHIFIKHQAQRLLSRLPFHPSEMFPVGCPYHHVPLTGGQRGVSFGVGSLDCHRIEFGVIIE